MKKALLAAALTVALVNTAQADIRINGFANFIGGMTSDDRAVAETQDPLYGYDDTISFREESLFALQASGDVNDRMSATVQVLARGENDFEVDFEWAYLTYRATNNMAISAGRFRLPLFRLSDSLDVGYSHHWISAPQSVYDVPFNNLDGFRIDYSDFAGDWEYKLGAAVGTFENEISDGTIEGDNTYMVSAEIANDWLSLRSVYGSAKTTFDQPELNSQIEATLRAPAPELADFLLMEEDTARFLGIGIEVDTFDWFIGGEYTTIDIEESYTPEDIAWYVTAGMRIGKWTPSVTYQSFEGDEVKGLDEVAALGEPLQSAITPSLYLISDVFAQNYTVASATIRYDYDANIAIKAEISRYSDDLNEDADATMGRIAINYVF
ncbi:topoisomerase IV [Alteromonas sp. 1_MG-2023]|uniref:topoisomerase IV n=1 Tax=Alteromonas sp. 1_MG-2023 TaxID=3062669 RepID=UPI0026E42BCF|nr:topoisomerase IV [Alteromonas sp. 1_MG-2023]MDO6566954.1 topoisomerase IV [Alteromonas sp. 1_MG-2023]